MAQVSSGSFNTGNVEGRSLKFNWAVDNTNIEQNYKEIYWSLVGDGDAQAVWYETGNITVVIDGETVYTRGRNDRIQLHKGTVVASGYKKIYHDTYGKKTFSASVKGAIYYYDVNVQGSGIWELPTIPRYANFTVHEITWYDETSVTVKWNADAVCDDVQYSLNGGSWTPARHPTYTISGLSANTRYTIKTRIKRKDSQLWTESGALSFTTHNFPHCTSSPDFTIGDALTLDFYNPLGRSISVYGYSKTDGREIFNGSTNGTRLVGFNDGNSVNNQYASIPNRQDDQYTVVVVYNDTPMMRDAGNVYKIRGNEVPTINAFDYEDNNANVYNITGNKKHIVQNKSELVAMFHPATANYGASGISQYYLECNGKTRNGSSAGAYSFGTIDSANDVELKLTATDSRGLSASKTIKVTMLEHSNPNAIVTLERLNNYEDETYLTVDGSISSVNGKNTMAIQYRYKSSSGNYNGFEQIGDRATKTLSCDKNNVYIFNIVVTDAFGGTFDAEFLLDKGMFPLFIDTVKNSVGINCFPKHEKSLEINGMLPPVATTIDNLSSYDDIEGDLKRSGFYTCGQGDTWCNLINLRHRNGEGDGVYYGLQIRNTMLTKQSKLQVRNHDVQGWGDWRNLQEEGKVLFSGDENSRISLNESLVNFSSVEIHYSLRTSGVDYFQSVKVHNPQGKHCSLMSALPNAGYVIVGMGTVYLDGESITFTTNCTFANGDMNNPVTTDEMHIFTVIGFR